MIVFGELMVRGSEMLKVFRDLRLSNRTLCLMGGWSAIFLSISALEGQAQHVIRGEAESAYRAVLFARIGCQVQYLTQNNTN
jgi:hypothetical protein